MADRYWVGGTASWDGTAGTKWALTSGGAGGQAVPTSADDVFFSSLSTGTCTISNGNTGAKSINCTGHLGTIAGAANISVAGSVTFVATQTVTYSGTLTLTATGTLTTGGKTLGPVTVNAVGGTITLGSALTSSGQLIVTAGEFNTSGSSYSVTSATLSSTNSNVRTIALNGSTVTLTTTIFSSSLDFGTSTNLTFTAGTSTIAVTGNRSLETFNGGGRTFYDVSFSSISLSYGRVTINQSNTFNTLTIPSPSVDGLREYRFAANQTITTLVCSGTSAVNRVRLYGESSARTLTVTNWATISDVDFFHITMNSSRSGTRLGDCSGNTSVTFDAAKTVYWNLAGTQDWSATAWATTSGGSPAVNNFPLAQDTVVFDNTGAAGTISLNSVWSIGTFSAGGRTSAMTLSGGNAIFGSGFVAGDWTNGTGVTLSLTKTTDFVKISGTQTITSSGKSFHSIATPIVTSIGATITLADALTTTTSTANEGFNIYFPLSTAGFSVTTNYFSIFGAFTPANSLLTITGTGQCCVISGAVTGLADITLSNTTTLARNLILGNKTYGTLTIGGASGSSTTTFTGTATFTAIASTKTVAHTIVFPNVTTTVGAFNVNGSAGNVVTLSRTGASGVFTLAKSGGGTVTVDRLSISNSTASPGSTWTATNSIDGGGNTGWTITAPPPPLSGGNFFQFFV
jgi:hypothetical protein